MAVIGCLPPFILLIVGAGIGFAIGGTTTGIWGAIAGFVVGLIGTVVLLKAFLRARGGLPE